MGTSKQKQPGAIVMRDLSRHEVIAVSYLYWAYSVWINPRSVFEGLKKGTYISNCFLKAQRTHQYDKKHDSMSRFSLMTGLRNL